MTHDITWRLEHDRIGPLLRHYAIPAVIGTMVNALYNIIDRIFIGQGVGALAISGLTLTFPVMLMLQAFGMLVGTGAAARISIFLGRKENDRAAHVLGNAAVLLLIVNVATIVPSMLFMHDMLWAFGGSEQTIPYAEEYLRIVVPGQVLAAFSFSFNAIMRASGYPKKAMYLMLLGAVLNVILDPLFIFWLDMGIRGAAIATVISMGVSAFFVMAHFVRKDSLVRLQKRFLWLDRSIVLAIVAIGVSPFTMQLTASLVNVLLNNTLKAYGGDLAVGALGIVSSVGMLLILLNLGIAMGMQPIVGFNHGAGLQQRVLDTVRRVLVANTTITGIGCLCAWFIPGILTRCFTNDPELVSIATNAMRLTLAAFLVVGSQVTITQYFQSIGVAWKAMFLSLSRQVIFLIPAILILPVWFGLDGVWLAYPFSDFFAALTAWILFAKHVKNIKRSNGM